MITELLEPGFVQKSAVQMVHLLDQEKTAQERRDPDAETRGSDAEVGPGELDEAKAELEGAMGEAEKLAGGPQDPAYYPRDPVLGLLQSSLQRYWLDKTDLVARPAGHGLAPSDVPISDIRLRPGALSGPQGFARPFEQTDIGWASCWFARLVRAFKHKHPFRADPAPPCRIADKARLVIIGDWGTGLPRARQVAASMRDVIAAPDDREQHVIHLGDVYYSGWRHEYDEHFLPFWPVRESEAGTIGSWALNSNHDMFSGAWDYFDYLLAKPQFQRQGGSSFFRLENDHWQILALDSAYEGYDLFGLQANWVKETRQAAPHKKGLLLSHHQLFSAFEGGSPKIEQKLRPVLDAGLVTGWFWGHEHRCAVYEPRHNIRFPRCVGHGGVPVWAPDGALPPGVRWQETDYLADGLERFARFGFAVLDFDGPRIRVSYRGEHGQIRHQETIE